MKVIVDEDADMARLYRESYGDVKADKEKDYTESIRLHDKYAYLFDRKTLDRKMASDKYNLAQEKESIEEEMLTTELSDEELDLVYKRYKIMQHKNSDKLKDIEGEAYELVQQFNAGIARTKQDRPLRTPQELQNEVGLILNKKVQRKRFNTQIEQHMA